MGHPPDFIPPHHPALALREAVDAAAAATAVPKDDARLVVLLLLDDGDPEILAESLGYDRLKAWFVGASKPLTGDDIAAARARLEAEGGLSRLGEAVLGRLAAQAMMEPVRRRYPIERLAHSHIRPRPQGARRRLRIVHHLGRTGGTLFNKCLLAQGDVVVLSEVHPFAYATKSPLEQADEWFGLFSPAEKKALSGFRTLSYVEMLEMIVDRAEALGKAVIVREWNHADYTPFGLPLEPTFRMAGADVLASHFDLIRIATVRHPLDHWLSLWDLYTMQTGVTPPLGFIMDGIAGFNSDTRAMPTFRYEDLVAMPALVLEEMCAALEIAFNPNFEDAVWNSESKVSTAAIGTRGVERKAFQKLDRRPVSALEYARINATPRYHDACTACGYDPSGRI